MTELLLFLSSLLLLLYQIGVAEKSTFPSLLELDLSPRSMRESNKISLYPFFARFRVLAPVESLCIVHYASFAVSYLAFELDPTRAGDFNSFSKPLAALFMASVLRV